MRIKRLAIVGTTLLVVVCFGLYLLLDSTLTNEQKSVRRPKSVYSRITYTKQELKSEDSTKLKSNISIQDIVSSCYAPVNVPDVDIQMGQVYDAIPFDNIDGGVWKQGWNVVYDERQWNKNKKLKIFVCPHSHNDPGWKRTFEDYYTSQTRSILNNMVTKLLEDEKRKFIWAEISFFSLWWSEISQPIKDKVKLLLSRGQLEFVTGGWVMSDEANSHYYSFIEQLLHGHQWLLNNLGYKPRHSWSIDPFGLSPTFPYILKKSGFKALTVQRTHYSVKKYLARNKQLEFRWRQLWDNNGWTELMTHMMPFYSYDIPHTCGPDPKVCCQFDFKRLPGFGLSCPWHVMPQTITEENIRQRSELLLDQYRKKAQLYSTNVLFVPLGDDFRYDHSTEWDQQFINYQKIFDYINGNPVLNAHAQFGTLSDYFNALHEEKKTQEFPTLSGDFFTYADREDHYWSGYYTSRPFYKRMDRVLISYLRSAEILLSLLARQNSQLELISKLNSNLSDARSSLSLFQHHDGITGTAKTHVVQDYAQKMLEAIHKCQHVIQLSSFILLNDGKASDYNEMETYLTVDEHQKIPQNLAEGVFLTFPTGVHSRKVFVFNPLSSNRREIITIKVQNELVDVQVKNAKGEKIVHQTTQLSSVPDSISNRYMLSFIADLKPLSLTYFIVEPAESYRRGRENFKLIKPPINEAHVNNNNLKNENIGTSKDFSIQNNNISVTFSKIGLLKAITIKKPDNIVTIPVHLNFVRYSTKHGPDKSGAYLFLPDGEAEDIKVNPELEISEGRLKSTVTVKFTHVEHTVTIYNSGGPDDLAVEIKNIVNLGTIKTNYELAMRFSSNIKNGNDFYTDLNGFQIIKRKRLSKLPLQGNYYPMPSSAYIQDNNIRLSVLSGQPLGVASLHEGQIEIMQDRKLIQDDNRGLDQPVTDNRITLSIFRLIVETKSESCDETDSQWGRLSENAHINLQRILYPVQKLFSLNENHAIANKEYIPPLVSIPSNVHLATSLLLPGGLGVLIQTTSVDKCFASDPYYKDLNKVNLSHIIPMKTSDKIYKSTLTFNDMLNETLSFEIPLCENNIDAYFIRDL